MKKDNIPFSVRRKSQTAWDRFEAMAKLLYDCAKFRDYLKKEVRTLLRANVHLDDARFASLDIEQRQNRAEWNTLMRVARRLEMNEFALARRVEEMETDALARAAGVPEGTKESKFVRFCRLAEKDREERGYNVTVIKDQPLDQEAK